MEGARGKRGQSVGEPWVSELGRAGPGFMNAVSTVPKANLAFFFHLGFCHFARVSFQTTSFGICVRTSRRFRKLWDVGPVVSSQQGFLVGRWAGTPNMNGSFWFHLNIHRLDPPKQIIIKQTTNKNKATTRGCPQEKTCTIGFLVDQLVYALERSTKANSPNQVPLVPTPPALFFGLFLGGGHPVLIKDQVPTQRVVFSMNIQWRGHGQKTPFSLQQFLEPRRLVPLSGPGFNKKPRRTSGPRFLGVNFWQKPVRV